jgi:hypothetical protein
MQVRTSEPVKDGPGTNVLDPHEVQGVDSPPIRTGTPPLVPRPACGDLSAPDGPPQVAVPEPMSARGVRGPFRPVSRPIGSASNLRYPPTERTVR